MNLEELFIYEDPYLWILNKPAGLHSSNSGKSPDSLARSILEVKPEQQAVSDEAGLVQRLDFETSGCITVARSADVASALLALFTGGAVHKSYLILTEGKMKSCALESRLGSRYRGSKKTSVYKTDSEKPRTQLAETNFEVLKYLDSNTTLVRAHTTTGRRHQVRAHAAHLGYPLLGDVIYGSKQPLSTAFQNNQTPAFFLHAEELTFNHPTTGQALTVRAPLPAYAEPLSL